jgi:hypothetical protein
MARVRELTTELATVGSQTNAGGEADAAAALLLEKERQIRKLRDQLAVVTARARGEAPPAPLPSDGAVRATIDLDVPVTTIDGEPISRRDFCEYLFRDLGTPGLLELFANRELVLREARRRCVVVDDVAVRVWMEEQLIDQIGKAGSEQTFAQQLAENGYTRESWEARLRYQARPQLLLYRLVLLERTTPEGREAFEARVREIYERDYSERVTARHILIKCPLNAPPEEVQLCRERATLAQTEVQRGKPFAEVVARRSEDAVQTKRIGGSLGTFDRTRFKSEAALNTALFTADPGTPVVVRSSQGFHVVLVDERKPPTRPFDGATRALIIKTIEKEPPAEAELLELVSRLRARSHVVHSLSFD